MFVWVLVFYMSGVLGSGFVWGKLLLYYHECLDSCVFFSCVVVLAVLVIRGFVRRATCKIGIVVSIVCW
jgi:hypothetical protein